MDNGLLHSSFSSDHLPSFKTSPPSSSLSYQKRSKVSNSNSDIFSDGGSNSIGSQHFKRNSSCMEKFLDAAQTTSHILPSPLEAIFKKDFQTKRHSFSNDPSTISTTNGSIKNDIKLETNNMKSIPVTFHLPLMSNSSTCTEFPRNNFLQPSEMDRFCTLENSSDAKRQQKKHQRSHIKILKGNASRTHSPRWTQKDLSAALQLVKSGTPIKPAAEKCNMPVMTLWRRTRALGLVSSKVQCGFRYPTRGSVKSIAKNPISLSPKQPSYKEQIGTEPTVLAEGAKAAQNTKNIRIMYSESCKQK